MLRKPKPDRPHWTDEHEGRSIGSGTSSWFHQTLPNYNHGQTEKVKRWPPYLALALCFCVQGLIQSLMDSAGALFPSLNAYFARSCCGGHIKAALIVSVQLGCQFLLCPFSSYVASAVGVREAGIIGGIMLFTGLFCASFAQTFWSIFFFFSIIVGTGASLAFMSSSILMSKHFSENCMMEHSTVGMSNGVFNLFMPHLIDHMEEQFGLFDTLRFMALLFYTVPALCLMMPIPKVIPRASKLMNMLRITAPKSKFNPDHQQLATSFRKLTNDEIVERLNLLESPSLWCLGSSPLDMQMPTTATNLCHIGPKWFMPSKESSDPNSLTPRNSDRIRPYPKSGTDIFPAPVPRLLPNQNQSNPSQDDLNMSVKTGTTTTACSGLEDSNLNVLSTNSDSSSISSLFRDNHPGLTRPCSALFRSRRRLSRQYQSTSDTPEFMGEIDSEHTYHRGRSDWDLSSLPTSSFTTRMADSEEISAMSEFDDVMSHLANFMPRLSGYSDDMESIDESDSRQFWSSLPPALMRSQPFLVMLMAMPIAMMGYSMPNVHLVEYCRIQFPLSNGNYLISLLGLAAAFGPILHSLTRKYYLAYVHTYRVFQGSVVAYGVVVCFIPVANSFRSLLALCILIGLFEGIIQSLITPLCLELTSQEAAGLAIGIYYAVCGVPACLAAPLGSLLYQTYHRYSVAFFACGVAYLTGGLILSFAQLKTFANKDIPVGKFVPAALFDMAFRSSQYSDSEI